MQSYSLKLKLMSDEPTGVFESRKGKFGDKKGGGLGALLGMALMMKGTLGALGKNKSYLNEDFTLTNNFLFSFGSRCRIGWKSLACINLGIDTCCHRWP